MKKHFMKLASALICTMTTVLFASCSSEDRPSATPDAEPSSLADVTIMYYGHGGGNLDTHYMGNIRGMYKAAASSYKNVKIAVEYKFSKEDNLPDMASESEMKEMDELVRTGGKDAEAKLSNLNYLKWMNPVGSSTLRFVVDPAQTLKEQAQGHYLPGKNAEISNPDSLANFIKWAAKACPAKKYVLVLNDHGGGYSPDAEIYQDKAAATRGVIFDDANSGNHFSAPSLNHAIKASGIRPDVVYYDACLMNTLEYAFELKDVADYLVASTYVTLAGAPYATLIDVLSAAHDDMRYALEKYTEYYVKSFEPDDENEVNYYDMTVTETARLDQLGKSMREFTDRLCNTYKNGTAEQKQKIDNVTRDAVRVTDSGALYDAGRYMEAMRKALPEVFDDAFWAELKESFNNCIAAQYTSKYLLNHDYEVDYSVLLATRGTYLQSTWEDVLTDPESKRLTKLSFFDPDGKFTNYVVKDGLFKKDVTPAYTLELADQGQWGGTLEAVYGALAFDKATGWSRWLLLNEQQPSLWCNNDFNTPLPKISD